MEEIVCFKCNKKFLRIKGILLHFKISHQLVVGSILMCHQTASCQRKFHTFATFKKHLISIHNIQNDLMLANECETVKRRRRNNFQGQNNFSSAIECNSREPDSLNLYCNENINFDREIKISEDKVKNLTVQFCSKLYANPAIPRNQIQFIIDNVIVLLKKGFGPILSKLLKEPKSSNECDIQTFIDLFENPFQNLDTEKKD